MNDLNLVLLGPPGAGKGTQAEFICEKYSIPHISTGDILRQEMRDGTELGKKAKGYIDQGLLVPDDLIIDMAKKRLADPDCKAGYLLDGFPRTVAQAEALDKISVVTEAVNIDVPSEKIVARISGRRVCRDCGMVYHIKSYDKDVCEHCGGELYHRDDDQPETVKNRLAVYETQTKPLLDYYEKAGKLVSVDGDQPVETVFEAICTALEQRR